MNKQKIILSVAVVLTAMGMASGKINANYQYGNGQPSRQIIIDKEVKPEHWSGWHDNLSIQEYTFTAENKVDFKVVVKNTGESGLDKVKVIDFLPDYITLLSGPEGYSHEGNQVKWEIDHLNAGEEKEYKLQAQIAKSDTLSGKGSFCITNRARVEAESGENDEDTSQFCLEGPEGRVLGAKLPETGSQLAVMVTIALATAGVGLASRKYSK